MNGDGMGHFAKAQNHRQADARDAENALPRVQRYAEKQERPMLERDVQARRNSMALLALFIQRGFLL